MLADLLAPGSNDVRLHLLDEGVELTLGDLWRRADAVAGWLATLEGRPAAMVLTNSAACVTVLVGALVHGAHVVSLPPPWPGADATSYGRFLSDCCDRAGADHLVVDARYLSALPPVATVTAVSYEEVGGGVGARPLARSPFVLTQFTSGSTTEPKGVVLDEAAIEANVRAILEWLGPEPGEGACSWLPLSHDMGLIGLFLTALVGGGPGWADGADLVLLTPEGFRRDPRCWLRACAAYRSAVTAVPNLALEMAMRRPPGDLDLGALRTCIVGAEPIRPDTLRRFEAVYRRHGFGPLAFSPAYGLAECTLAVAGVRPAERWTSSPPPPGSTEGGTGTPWAGEVEVVSCGSPLTGLEVRVDGAEDRRGTAGRGVRAGAPAPSGPFAGTVSVRGRSVARTYDDGAPVAGGDGWFETGDLGWLDGGQLFVVGRREDLLFVAGRNVHAVDVERVVGEVAGIRSARVAAVQPAPDTLVVVAEFERRSTAPDDEVRRMSDQARRQVVRRLGVSPHLVVLVPRGRLAVTASGKPRRGAVLESIARCPPGDAAC